MPTQGVQKIVFIKNVFVTPAVALLVLLLLVACASEKKHVRLYAGPERPDAEIAALLIVETLEASSINGVDIPRISRVIRSGDRRLDLLPGSYDVAVYYDAIWRVDDSNEEAVRSEPQLVNLQLEAGHTYRVEHESVFDLEDARSLARDMKVTVVDLSSGQPVQVPVESRPAKVSTPVVVNPIPPLEGDAAATTASATAATAATTTATASTTAATVGEGGIAAASASSGGGVSVAPLGSGGTAQVAGGGSDLGVAPIVTSAPAAELTRDFLKNSRRFRFLGIFSVPFNQGARFAGMSALIN